MIFNYKGNKYFLFFKIILNFRISIICFFFVFKIYFVKLRNKVNYTTLIK